MRICHLIWNYGPGPEGGAERQLRALAPHLAERGHEVTIVTRWSVARAPRVERSGRITIRRIGWFSPIAEWLSFRVQALKEIRPRGKETTPPGSGLDGCSDNRRSGAGSRGGRWGPVLFLQWKERWVFLVSASCFFLRSRGKFDILHVHESTWIAGVGCWLGRLSRVPVVVKEALLPVLLPMDRGFPLAAAFDRLRRRPAYIALTDAAAEALAGAGIGTSNISVVPNGVEVSPVRADVARNRDVLFAGNFTQGAAHKGFDILLRVWAAVHGSCAHSRLLIAGRGDTEPWRKLARDLGVEDAVEFLGFADLASIYPRCALFLFPSRREGMSNALLEAMSAGLPPVVSDIPPNCAIVDHGRTGWICPSEDVASMAFAVRTLLSDPARRAEMGSAARSEVVKRFGLPSVAARLEAVYEQLRVRVL